MATKSKSETAEIQITPLRRASVRLRLIGVTPMFQNRMSNKVQEYLLVGGRKKTAAERVDIKHNPREEYRNSAEIVGDGPTALGVRVTAIKGAMCTAAIETAGLTKTSAQRLLFMPGDLVPLYGTPYLRMDVVRSADINRTPDVRSRAFLPKWGAEIEIQYIVPQLSASSVISLLCNAGVLIGIGDYRQEKGKGAFGSFRVIGEGQKDAEWDDLVKHHGRKVQLAALADPQAANEETESLLAFFDSEVTRRSNTVPEIKKTKATKTKGSVPGKNGADGHAEALYS